MFSQLSTDNLLDNLESELTEIVELDSPKNRPRPSPRKFSESKISPQKNVPPPVAPRRNFFESSPEKQKFPVPAVRKAYTLDKRGKNSENEIIQMSSFNSDHASTSSDVEHFSRGSSTNSRQSTVISFEEKPKKKKSSDVRVVHEGEKISQEESFFVIKHGKWADENENEHEIEEIKEKVESIAEKVFKSALEVISEKPAKKSKKKSEDRQTSLSSGVATFKSDSESSSVFEKPEPIKKVKKPEKVKKSKKKTSSEEVTSATTTQASKKETLKKDATSDEKCIGVFVNNTGAIKYSNVLKSPRIKISLYNEDNGKQIGDVYWTKTGTFNNDFYNLICTWNDMIIINYDLKKLRELYNNVLIFFEMINTENVPIAWAFLKLLSQTHINNDSKLKLQFFQYHTESNSCFGLPMFKKKIVKHDLGIFDQWQLHHKKFACTLNIYIKDMNHGLRESVSVIESKCEAQTDKFQLWKKIPGQACKIPNKIYNKISMHDKGSMMVKFSHDGGFIAFTEIPRDGFFFHVYKFPEMTKIFTMLEHSNLIHDIDWLKQKIYTNQRIVTASSDFTAIVWKLEADSYTYTILPHPCFIYASKFLYKEDSDEISVVTAGRDSIIRIWRNKQKAQSFELIQELKHPVASKFTYVTSLVTRNADTFYTASSTGDIIEWTLRSSDDYHLNRKFNLAEIKWKIIGNIDLNPRGNKIYFRVYDMNALDVANTIYVLGVPTGEITQRLQQVQCETKGVVKVTPCGTQLFSTNKNCVRFYQTSSGNLVPPEDDKNVMNVKLPLSSKNFITSMDYHPKDFYFACSIYGTHGSVVICSFESNDRDTGEFMKVGSQEMLNRSFEVNHQLGNLNNILRRLDEVFLSPNDLPQSNERNFDEATFTIQNSGESKRSKTYTVSQGPATFTINKGNDTYEIQRDDKSDDEDDTTISQSLN